ncbi:hypothetical protein PV328_007095 [Microctonus aethiopoides]|uniref:Uncharacterized protein n=1 Tax=Microctonus aethiopoides TaxID=144406 RepID=A0AA39KU89_9HYME|nr:hypothetical protein PV328_007095 [Microctonus aethiopoides]
MTMRDDMKTLKNSQGLSSGTQKDSKRFRKTPKDIINISKGDMEEDGKAVESAVFIETLNTRIREREKQQKKKKKKKIWVWGILHSGRGVAGGVRQQQQQKQQYSMGVIVI